MSRKVTIEVIPSYDWERDYHYFSVYVAVKSEYQRYDVGESRTEKEGYKKAIKWIANNLQSHIIDIIEYHRN